MMVYGYIVIINLIEFLFDWEFSKFKIMKVSKSYKYVSLQKYENLVYLYYVYVMDIFHARNLES